MKTTNKMILAATIAVTLTLANRVSAFDLPFSPKSNSRHPVVQTGAHDTDYVHNQTALGNAAASKSAGHPVVAGSAQDDPNLIKALSACSMSPHMKDSPECKRCKMMTMK